MVLGTENSTDNSFPFYPEINPSEFYGVLGKGVAKTAWAVKSDDPTLNSLFRKNTKSPLVLALYLPNMVDLTPKSYRSISNYVQPNDDNDVSSKQLIPIPQSPELWVSELEEEQETLSQAYDRFYQKEVLPVLCLGRKLREKGHSNLLIPRVCMFIGRRVLVAERMQGDLKAYISLKRLQLQEAAFVISKIAKGVSFLHENGVVHRDIAARNILYETDDKGRIRFKLSDWGRSRELTDQGKCSAREKMFPVAWMAPEEVRSHYSSPESDVYALGMVALELVVPFSQLLGSNEREHLASLKNTEALSEQLSDKDPDYLYRGMPRFLADRIKSYDAWQENKSKCLTFNLIFFEAVRKCVQFNPKSRSSAARVSEQFRHVSQQKVESQVELEHLPLK